MTPLLFMNLALLPRSLVRLSRYAAMRNSVLYTTKA